VCGYIDFDGLIIGDFVDYLLVCYYLVVELVNCVVDFGFVWCWFDEVDYCVVCVIFIVCGCDVV